MSQPGVTGPVEPDSPPLRSGQQAAAGHPTPGAQRHATISCSVCGITVDGPPMTWMRETDPRRGHVWVCDRCARANLRAIEAKLEQEWW